MAPNRSRDDTLSLEHHGRVLPRLEEAVNRIPFAGISLGSVLNQYYITRVYHRPNQPLRQRIRDLLKSYALRVKYTLRPLGSGTHSPATEDARGRLLFTMIDDSSRFRGLIEPVLDQIAPEDAAVIAGVNVNTGTLPADVPAFRFSDGGPYDVSQWRREFARVRKPWRKALRAVIDDEELDSAHVSQMLSILMAASQRVLAYRSLLDRLAPRAVLTEYDRNSHTACLVLAARQLGIPSATLVHGSFSSGFGFVPLVANRIFVWGEVQRTQLMDAGVPAERIRITGNPTVRPAGDDLDRYRLRERMGWPPETPVIMLATNPVSPAILKIMLERFGEALGSDGNTTSVIRSHPSQKPEQFEQTRRAYPAIRYVLNGEQSVPEAMATTDVLVCHNTTLAVEAMLSGVPVIIVDLPGLDPGFVGGLVEQGICPLANDAGELRLWVDRILSGHEEAIAFRDRAARFIASMYNTTGEEAARITARQARALGKADTEQPSGA